MDEFAFIATYLAPLAGPEGLFLKDDAACLIPPDGCDLVLTKDTMVEGVHFPRGRHGGDVAEKLLRVNLSDLAAKGARPLGYLLSLALPRAIDRAAFSGFAKGLRDVQDAYDFALWGGDTVSTEGPMIMSATLIGAVPTGGMVKRSGAKAGDDVWLTGTIGDAWLGLQHVLGHPIAPPPDGQALWLWEEAYLRPEPRLLLRKVLRTHATAAVDISDGLLADIGHIAKASHVGIVLEEDRLPLSDPTQTWLEAQPERHEALLTLLTAGDDYEVAFSADPASRAALRASSGDLGIKLTCIGTCISDEGVRLQGVDGQPSNPDRSGYTHF